FTPREANSARHATSHPGASAPTPQNTIAVFHGPRTGSESHGAPGGVPTRASHTNRVSLSATSSTPARSSRQPYLSAASLLASAAHGPSCSATSLTASAVELPASTRARGNR